jgi:hypothetical protein
MRSGQYTALQSALNGIAINSYSVVELLPESHKSLDSLQSN